MFNLPITSRFKVAVIDIEEQEASRTIAGTTVLDWTAISTAIPCSIQDPSASTVNRFNQDGEIVTHTIFVGSSEIEEPKISQRIKEGSKYYRIKGSQLFRKFGRIESHYQIHCEEIVEG